MHLLILEIHLKTGLRFKMKKIQTEKRKRKKLMKKKMKKMKKRKILLRKKTVNSMILSTNKE